MIVTTCHFLRRESSSGGEGKGEEGHYRSFLEKAMKGPDERVDAQYPAIYTINRQSGGRL
jgi:hypothetical protein